MKHFLILATIFLFASCVDIERGNPEDPGSRNYNVNRLSSSPSVELSSSSEPFSNSSSVPQSSSSVAASSSSLLESSSSSKPSSSSIALPSSSSVAISSSSLEESSSSSMLSSSSSALPSSSSVTKSSSSVAISSSSVCTASDNTEKYYCSNGTMKEYGFVTYQEQTYKTVVIGTQTWMAENLNYNVPGSLCYGDLNGDDSQGNCAIYGRLYNWATADTVCPSGWHLPSNAEWNTLMKFVNPSCTDNSTCAGAGTKLKSATDWTSYSGVPAGTDDYGFSALPGGFGGSDGSFSNVGRYGFWWSSSEHGSDFAYYRYMYYDNEYVYYSYYGKYHLRSVRCLQD